MTVPEPSFIRGDVQLNVKGPNEQNKFAKRKLEAPELGLVEVTEEGNMKFPNEIWLRISGPGIDRDGMTVCTDENGNLALGSLGLQRDKVYVVKYDSPSKAETASVASSVATLTTDVVDSVSQDGTGGTTLTETVDSTSQLDSATFQIKGPNKSGMFERQDFQSPFPGVLGAVVFDQAARLTFADTNLSVTIEISGLGLSAPKTFQVRPTGLILRSVGMLERDPAELYTITVFRPQA